MTIMASSPVQSTVAPPWGPPLQTFVGSLGRNLHNKNSGFPLPPPPPKDSEWDGGIVVDSVVSNLGKLKPPFLTLYTLRHIGIGSLTSAIGRNFCNLNYAFLPRPTTLRVVDSNGKHFYHLKHYAKMPYSIPPHHATGGRPAATATAAARTPLASPPLLRSPPWPLLGPRTSWPHPGPSATRSHARRLKVPLGGPLFGLSPQCPAHRAVTSLWLLAGLRPPAPCVPQHLRCSCPLLGPLGSQRAYAAKYAQARGPHQRLPPPVAYLSFDSRQPTVLERPPLRTPLSPRLTFLLWPTITKDAPRSFVAAWPHPGDRPTPGRAPDSPPRTLLPQWTVHAPPRIGVPPPNMGARDSTQTPPRPPTERLAVWSPTMGGRQHRDISPS